MHTSGFVALALLVLIIVVAVLAFSGGRLDNTARETLRPVTQRR